MPATLLCIDDQQQGLEIRKLLLHSQGYRVITASSGPEGLSLLRGNEVDAVILDYRMEGMNGEAVAQDIRRDWPKLPIIILSGFPKGIPERLSSMVDSIVVKGQPVVELLAAIAKALGHPVPKCSTDSRTKLLEASKLAVEHSERVLAEIEETKRAAEHPSRKSTKPDRTA